jgi:hypothetical protein
MPEHDDGRDREMVGCPEELLHLRLASNGHRGDDASEPLGARREQQVPHEGIDGRATRKRVTGEITVGGRERA